MDATNDTHWETRNACRVLGERYAERRPLGGIGLIGE
jgi:hypothetical protein